MIKCKEALKEIFECTNCCYYCEKQETCDSVCGDIKSHCHEQVEEETELQVMESAVPEAIQIVTEITVQMEKLEAQQKLMKQKLIEAMEQNGIKKFENDKVLFTYVAQTTKTTFDKKAFEKAHPEINLSDYDKVSPVSASVRIKVK